MLTAAELSEHCAGVLFILRFPKDESIAFGDGVGGENNRARRAGGIAPLAVCVFL
jgi:hypothetical protein